MIDHDTDDAPQPHRRHWYHWAALAILVVVGWACLIGFMATMAGCVDPTAIKACGEACHGRVAKVTTEECICLPLEPAGAAR